MNSSQFPSEPAAAAKPAPYCAFPGCKVPPTDTCSRCLETRYCSKVHQTAHWKWHKKICVAPQKKISAPVPLKGSLKEEEEDEVKCVVCLDNVVNAKLKPCGHSATCRECTQELMNLKEPCPLCRKLIASFTVGKWQSTIGEHGLWLTSLKNLTQLAGGEGFNEFFRNQFNGNEATYLRWKEVFDELEIGNARDVGPDLPLEQQVLMITKSEDLVKLRALAKLCSLEFFEDSSLSVTVEKRILEVLVLAMPPVVEKKVRGKKRKQKKKQNDPQKLEIFDACAALVDACNWVEDWDDSRRYFERAKEGYEEQLGPDDAKTLEATRSLIMSTAYEYSDEEFIEKLRYLVKRCERALGEENAVTLETR
ncbi:hypothetical protein TL16_g03151 [Triparma laevis f. inornata]|uniref:Uncharacterized protein n=2 Tax=Triparma laevis TaxID=1534972 RepID=A0A9W7F1B6_9STRA|nr:hypothetical protein TL16_g03151 [Triparma laevis f. inornata]GMI00010.1 hypothetical protein TrLO_g11737 [Triparma laevis f. longispina]